MAGEDQERLARALRWMLDQTGGENLNEDDAARFINAFDARLTPGDTALSRTSLA